MTAAAPDYRALVERITKVEHENRKMKRAGLAMLAVVAASLLTAESLPTKVVEANEFVLKDASGKMRARLWFGIKPSKSPPSAYLVFYDSTEQDTLLALSASAADHSAKVQLGSPQGSGPSVFLSSDAKGSYASLGTGKFLQGIQLSTETGQSRISLSGTGDLLGGGVFLSDSAEGGILQVHDAQGNAGVFIETSKGNDALSVVSREGDEAILFGDHLGIGAYSQDNLRAVLYGGKEGPYLTLTDNQGFQAHLGVSETVVKTTGLKRTSSAASLHMFDSKGTVIWSAP